MRESVAGSDRGRAILGSPEPGVEGANSVQVRLFDGRRFLAKVLGKDSRIDLAVLKIDGASGLPVLPLGDSNRIRVGEFVLALGHPFGLEHSVSFGIVSRKG